MEDECIGIIYMITNKTTLKSYIGQTRTFGVRKGKRVNIGLHGRWLQHCWKAKNNQDDCPAMSRAIRKYGPDNFFVEEIFNCPLEELNDAEIYFIALHETFKPGTGYNCTIGGDHPLMSQEQKMEMNRKISIKNKAHWEKRDRKEMSKKLSESTQKAMWRPEVRERLMASMQVLRKADLPPNIYERKDKGVLVGYEAKIKIKGVLYRGWFASKKNTLEVNFANAQNYIDDIKRKNL